MQVLLCLAERPGDVVSRQTLFDTVWTDMVVCEDALTRAISELRQVLGDDTASPHIIETIRKRGYRLIVPVRFDLEEERRSGAPSRELLQVAEPRRVTPGARIWMGAALLLVIIAAVWWIARPAEETASFDFLGALPLTSLPGLEEFPAISPDGKRVAFCWRGEIGENNDIFVKQLNSESLLPIADHPENEILPAWSPDGSEIAFVRWGDDQGIYICAALGGAERCLHRTNSSIIGIDWSPDGAWIACSERESDELPYKIVLISVQTLEVHPITSPEIGIMGDWWPAFSPDGKTIAFTRRDEAFQTDVFLVPAAGGEIHRLTRNHFVKGGLDWSVDGEQIFFGAGLNNSSNLWSVSVKSGAAKSLVTKGPAGQPSVSQTTGSLVFSGSTSNNGIVLAELTGEDSLATKTSFIIASTYSECHAHYSPDGRKMLFLSNRSGNPEIWISDSDGENLRQLTQFDGADVFTPRWSPDGEEIAFGATLDSCRSVYVISAAGGTPRSLSDSGRHELFNCWSGDGNWLYMTTQPDSVPEIRRISRNGEITELVASPGRAAIGETAEGKNLYYVHPNGLALWKVDLENGVESCEVDGEACADWTDPVVVKGGIYFVRLGDGENILSFYRFADRTIESIVPLPEFTLGDLGISPDRKQFLYNRKKEAMCDLFLVERIS